MLSGKTVRSVMLGAVLILVLMLAAPVTAAPPNNPFVGSWNTIYIHDLPGIDVSEISYQIGGNGHIHFRTNATHGCLVMYGEPWPSSGSGFGEVINEDPYVLAGDFAVYCHTNRGRQIVYESFHLELEYDPTTDTMFALHYPPDAQFNCAWRTGSDPSVCDPG